MFGGLALMHLSISGDFWTQLPTFFWRAASVVVTGHTLQMSSTEKGPMGKVTFETSGAEPRRFTDHVSQRFVWGDVSAQTQDFIAKHAPGSVHVAYLSPDLSKASLGHFPRSYSPWFAMIGIAEAVFCLLAIWRWRAEIRAR